jgi:DNA-binding response OmpR family regulator
MTRIIVVEQDVEQKEQLMSFLSQAGHDVRGAGNGDALSACLARFIPEIVLLDCDLNNGSETGITLAQRLHDHYATTIGIIMVTSHNNMNERIECRRAGADHYLVKPVVVKELLAIIANLAPRLTPSSREQAWRLFATDAVLSIPGCPAIALTGWEVVVLRALAAAKDQQISRVKLIEAMGKNPAVYDDRALEAGLSRLRRKLPTVSDGPALQAIRGFGYRFNHPLAIVR